MPLGAVVFGCLLAFSLSEIILTILDPFNLRVHGHSLRLKKNLQYLIDNEDVPSHQPKPG